MLGMSELDEHLTALIIWGINHHVSDILIEEGLNNHIQGLTLHQRLVYEYQSSLRKLIDFILHKAKLSLGSEVAQSEWCEVWTPQGFINLRVSYLKTMVCRFLTLRLVRHSFLNIESILQKHQYSLFETVLAIKHGLICFIGQAGSGKSTTLRSFLHSIQHRRIISIEHPIEYHCAFMMQIEQQQHDIEILVYHALRHHPHVLVIEEVRNSHELKVACEAALSGHLVCITFHAHNVELALQRMNSMSPHLDDSIIKAWFVQNRNEEDCEKIYVSIHIS
jgi:type II secretory ATPase GspE/PulE/Tfp pilus assembly ATPase PilB-like protein